MVEHTHEELHPYALISEIMFHLSFAQQFGLGLQVARDAMEENGNPSMEFDFAPTCVSVTPRSAR